MALLAAWRTIGPADIPQNNQRESHEPKLSGTLGLMPVGDHRRRTLTHADIALCWRAGGGINAHSGGTRRSGSIPATPAPSIALACSM